MTAALALQRALCAALSADAAILSLMGAHRVLDDIARGVRPPFIRFAAQASRDGEGSGDPLTEHSLSLELWSAARSRVEISALAGAALAVLPKVVELDPPFVLVNLEHEETRIERVDADLFRAVLRLRALTEESVT